ncbi:MAG: hypothetical protein WC647_12700 [Desulfomonilaceae bacterium]|jgi:hypothetical protein
MITRKKTLEMATPRRTGDEESARTKEFCPEVLDRVEALSPLDDMEFGELEAEVKLPEIEEPQKEPVPEKRAVQEKKLEIPKKIYELPKKYYMYAAIALVCLLLTMYLLIVQSYTVETRLVFIIGNRNALNKDNWSPLREMSVLQNPATSSLLTKRYYNGIDPLSLFNKTAQNTPESFFQDMTAVNPSLLKKDYFKNPVDFESWLSKSISFEPEFYTGQNRVVIKLTGTNPELLKGLLMDYVGSYVDLRRTIEAKSKETAGISAPKEPAADKTATQQSIDSLNEKIKRLESLEREYEMVLKVIEAGGGSGAASVDPQSPVFTTLARFQDKIIQLEIERGSLEARFTPQSHEIKSIDFQIEGVRGLMRQHLTEQMSYLKKDKDTFVAQKAELEQNSQAKTEVAEESRDMSKSSGMLASGAKWYFLNDGLSVINENPFITSKPLLGKLGDIKDALAASLFSSGNGSRNRPTGQYVGSMNNQYGPPPGQQYYEPSHYRGGPNMEQGPRQPMDFYHNDASSFVRR